MNLRQIEELLLLHHKNMVKLTRKIHNSVTDTALHRESDLPTGTSL